MAKSGRDAGPTLTAKYNTEGRRVRVTASSAVMAGHQGIITAGFGTTRAHVQFDSGVGKWWDCRRLQVMDPTLPDDRTGELDQVKTQIIQQENMLQKQVKESGLTDSDALVKASEKFIDGASKIIEEDKSRAEKPESEEMDL